MRAATRRTRRTRSTSRAARPVARALPAQGGSPRAPAHHPALAARVYARDPHWAEPTLGGARSDPDHGESACAPHGVGIPCHARRARLQTGELFLHIVAQGSGPAPPARRCRTAIGVTSTSPAISSSRPPGTLGGGCWGPSGCGGGDAPRRGAGVGGRGQRGPVRQGQGHEGPGGKT